MHFAFSPLFQQTSHITKSMGHPRKALVRASEAPPLWLSRRSGWVDPEGQPGLGPGCPSAGASGCSWPAGDSLSRPAPCPVRPASEFPRRVSRRRHRPQRAGRTVSLTHAPSEATAALGTSLVQGQRSPPHSRRGGPAPSLRPSAPQGGRRRTMQAAAVPQHGLCSLTRGGPPARQQGPRAPRAQASPGAKAVGVLPLPPCQTPRLGRRTAQCRVRPRGSPWDTRAPGSRGLSSASRVDDPELRGL